ncbi:MAG: hypothetical protein ACUZ8H_09910 [Candidatus Anammoxibacter sp.]
MIQLQRICPAIPILIMTAFYEEYMTELQKARAKGCLFELCRKPMDAKQIELIVSAYCESVTGMVEAAYGNKSEQVNGAPNYERHFFQLYLAGDASGYSKVVEGLRNIFDNHLHCYDLDVINLMENPELAEVNNIIANSVHCC